MKRVTFSLISLLMATGSVMASDECAQSALNAANDFIQDGRCGPATMDDVEQINEDNFTVTICKGTNHVVDIHVTTDSRLSCQATNVERTN
jgi:hypothetical protein